MVNMYRYRLLIATLDNYPNTKEKLVSLLNQLDKDHLYIDIDSIGMEHDLRNKFFDER